MPTSEYVRELRAKVGRTLLLLPGVAAVLRDPAGRLLLQQKESEGWSLPAGMIEPGECPEDALVREVLEETGLEVAPEKLLGVFGGNDFRYVYPNGDRVEYTVVMFLCTVIGRGEHPPEAETVSLRYFDRESAPPLALPYPMDLLFEEAGGGRMDSCR